ncbi:MAG: AEC family transporter [Arenicella sp.]
MQIIFNVLEIVSPVFILATIGFFWVKRGYDYPIDFVTNMVMIVGLPCLVFTALMKTKIDPDALASTFFASIAVYALITVAFFVLVKAFSLEVKTFLAPLIFSNTGNLGLPLALFAFGEAGLSYAIIVFAVMMIYSFSAGIWMVSGGGSPFRILKDPIFWGALLGALFMIQGWSTPTWLTNTVDLLGQLVIPLMLITLGVTLARLESPAFGRSVWLSVVKLVICIGASYGVGMWFGLDKIALAVLVVQVSTPVAVTSYLIAQKYGANADEVAGLVVVSTALSIIALPLMLGFLL